MSKDGSLSASRNSFELNLTSDFPDGLSGISTHYGECDYSVVLTTLQKGGGEEASCADVSWMSIPLDDMLTHVLL